MNKQNNPFRNNLIKAISLFLLFQVGAIGTQAQSIIGKKVSDLAKSYNSHFIYKQAGSKLYRTVFLKKPSDENLPPTFVFAYCDSTETIKIVLDQGYSFVEDYYWEIDTNYINSSSDFSEGLAAVKNISTKLQGYINEQGKIVIAPQYTFTDPFSEGLAYFAILERCNGDETRPNKMGYINKSNERVISLPPALAELYACCYFHGGLFRNGVAIMSTREFGFDCNCYSTIIIDKTGKILNYSGLLLDVYGVPVKLD
jgi:hypothetical protein